MPGCEHPNIEVDRDHVAIELDLTPALTLALQRNAVALVPRLRVRNIAGYDLPELRLRVWLDPAFGDGWETTLSLLPSDAEQVIDAPDLRLSAERLARVQERQSASLWAEVQLDDEVLLRQRHPIDVLAHNEWPGPSVLPEALAAFVLPNDPALTAVLRDAADTLDARTGNGSLNGYGARDDSQLERERSREIVSAIMEALAAREIGYALPPASFEQRGQKIRTPSQVLEGRLGTCLDLTVLAASAFEQAGLNPVIALVRGHALIGCWLSSQSYRDAAFDDPSRLRKRIDGLQLVVLDPNALTQERPDRGGFEWAQAEAMRHLQDDEAFVVAVDVARARLAHVRPLAFVDQLPDVAAGGARRGEADWSAPAVEAAETSGPDGAADPRTRLDRWKSKLLDLSLRNRLLNARPSKKTIPLQGLPPADLVAALARETACSVDPILARDEDDPRHERLLRQQAGGDPVRALLEADLAENRLHAKLDETELERRLVEIFRADNGHLQEGGSRILYLAAGFLRWYESDDSEQPRLAPLLLVPVELQRSSARGRLRLVVRPDEVHFNETLKEKLRSDFGIELPKLPALPDDLSELSPESAAQLTNRVLAVVGRAVADRRRWEVVKESWLGLFSFSKYLMWLDLHARTQQLKQNRIVKHLLETPGTAFDDDGEFPRPDRLDQERSPAETFCPLDADSSQLAAIHAAADGRSFVLEGPPGTGKSQTITNLIAHCLALGKRVLFVSEKRAALEVVYDRLGKVGLAPWCLELHSSKARKLEVVRQLAEALQDVEAREPHDWDRLAESLVQQRAKLNGLVRALHARREIGLTAHEAIGRLIASESLPLLQLDSSAAAVTATKLATMKEQATRLGRAAERVKPMAEHAWRASRLKSWHPGLNRQVPEIGKRVASAARAQREAACACLSEAYGARDPSLAALAAVASLARSLIEGPVAPRALVESTEAAGKLRGWAEKGERLQALRRQLGERYSRSLLELDPAPLKRVLEEAELKLPLLSWVHAWPVRRLLKKQLSSGKLPGDAELRRDLTTLGEARELTKELDALETEGSSLLSAAWRGAATDWKQARSLVRWATEYTKALTAAERTDWVQSDEDRSYWLDACALDGGPVDARLQPLRELLIAREVWVAATEAAQTSLELDPELAWGRFDEPGTSDRVSAMTLCWSSQVASLRDWAVWQRALGASRGEGLETLCQAVESGAVTAETAAPVVEKAMITPWLERLFAQERVLAEFHGSEQARRIERFVELDELLIELASKAVRARLARAAAAAGRSQADARAFLEREARKKKRHKPVRELLSRTRGLLPTLKPCLLMSPLSVAQYLDPEMPPFDVVVFDEASQLPAWDAVGAIARGEQLVVVGDSKQLPPTNFFMRIASDEELDEDEVEDLESILDECAAAGFRSLQLDWHYRSRHESLIAFSNMKYYGNRLLTFPSPDATSVQRGVGWRLVKDGVYDRSQSRTNRIEAEALVDEVERRLTHPDPVERMKSLGIVTFSNAQQAMIENLLDVRRRALPGIDRFFMQGPEIKEPVFVKNLENVQGDERDVILLSVCYGPDSVDRVTMNFGPLNQSGGERRLNVAVTRARERVEVFSSLSADRINTANTRAIGVRDLKDYLLFAERGPAVLKALTHTSPGAEPESPFEAQVVDRLRRAGYTVDCQVGCSGYRIDLAIRPSDDSGRYVLGIECDGATYHSAQTARDRDRLRQGVLERLGWRLHRIWSTDWWLQPQREWERLQGAVESAIADAELSSEEQEVAVEWEREPLYAGARPADEEDDPVADVDDEAPEADPDDSGPDPLPGPLEVAGETDVDIRLNENDESPELPFDSPPAATERDVTTPDDDPLAPDDPLKDLVSPVSWANEGDLARLGARAYSITPLELGRGSQEDFQESYEDETIAKVLGHVVLHEGPIRLELAAKRVAACWGFQRTRRRTVARVRSCIRRIAAAERPQLLDGFLWWHGDDPNDHDEFRVPTYDTATQRTAEELPPQEIRNAAAAVTALGAADTHDDLVTQTARLFGFARTGRIVHGVIEAALQDELPF